MGIESFNSPALVAAAGVGALAGLPTLETAIRNGAVSFLTVKIANALMYTVNIYAVQQPGRLDGKRQTEFALAKEDDQLFPTRRDRSLVWPSGWAFSIWALIFLGEMIFCSSSFLVDESSPVAGAIKKASAGFITGQFFQTLWAASFRPKYEGNLMYISAAMLSGIAWSMSRAHAAFVTVPYGLVQYLLYFFPISLHFGWTTAASLVNFNGNIAAREPVNPSVVAWAGHLSAVAATGLGVSVTLLRRAPVFGAVIAWALTACYTGMEERLAKVQDVSERAQVGILGARVQKWLCAIGALISAGSSIVVALDLRKDS